MSAELLERHELRDPEHDDHARTVGGHISTRVGVVSFRREGSDEVDENYFFVSGLVAGGAYEVPACEAAGGGSRSATTIRHRNRRFRDDVFEVDADEVADTVNVLGREGRVHIVGHSKGSKVALMAAARVDESVEVASVILVNPVVHAPLTRRNIVRRLRQTPALWAEGASAFVEDPGRGRHISRSVMREVVRRSPAIASETLALFRGAIIQPEDVERLSGRPGRRPTTIMAYGTDDHITPADDILGAVAEKGFKFDATLVFEGPVEGGHFGLMTRRSVMRSILSVNELVGMAMRHEHEPDESDRRPFHGPSRTRFEFPVED
jgi:pimeloyl-ACP methyl ester carboxylesterase